MDHHIESSFIGSVDAIRALAEVIQDQAIRGNLQLAFTLPGHKFTQGLVLKSTINFDCYIFEIFISRSEFSVLRLPDHHQLASEHWRKYSVNGDVVVYRKEVLSENGILRSVRSISRIFEHLGVDFEVGDK